MCCRLRCRCLSRRRLRHRRLRHHAYRPEFAFLRNPRGRGDGGGSSRDAAAGLCTIWGDVAGVDARGSALTGGILSPISFSRFWTIRRCRRRRRPHRPHHQPYQPPPHQLSFPTHSVKGSAAAVIVMPLQGFSKFAVMEEESAPGKTLLSERYILPLNCHLCRPYVVVFIILVSVTSTPNSLSCAPLSAEGTAAVMVISRQVFPEFPVMYEKSTPARGRFRSIIPPPLTALSCPPSVFGNHILIITL